jgi:hypothetical protein
MHMVGLSWILEALIHMRDESSVHNPKKGNNKNYPQKRNITQEKFCKINPKKDSKR